VGAHPQLKRGADGVIPFTDVVDNQPVYHAILVSVKGGEHVTLTMLKDLIATVEQRKAAMGVFVSLVAPTKPMIAEAAKFGFYTAGNGRQYRRLPLLTIEDLLAKRARPEYADFSMGEASFKQTKRDKVKGDQPRLI
jgi:hypothetical protein